PTQGLPVDRTEPVPWTASTATPSPAPRRVARRPRMLPVVAAAGVAGLLGGLGGGVLAQQLTGEAPQTPVVREATPVVAPASAEGQGSIPALSRAVLPSVALISVGQDGATGQGSGFVIRADGYVLTNHHVVDAAGDGEPITVELPGQEPMPAEVVGSDPDYDIA